MCGYMFTYMHPRFICVGVYIHRVWVGVYVVMYIHTDFALVCVHTYV